MEDTLRAVDLFTTQIILPSLNPCFNGRYSQSNTNLGTKRVSIVLILVLMEDTLRVITVVDRHPCFVLILVLMEDTLRVF